MTGEACGNTMYLLDIVDVLGFFLVLCNKNIPLSPLFQSVIMTWSRDLSSVPDINQVLVDEWANKEAKIPRATQTKGYSNFIEGYIHDVEGRLLMLEAL